MKLFCSQRKFLKCHYICIVCIYEIFDETLAHATVVVTLLLHHIKYKCARCAQYNFVLYISRIRSDTKIHSHRHDTQMNILLLHFYVFINSLEFFTVQFH